MLAIFKRFYPLGITLILGFLLGWQMDANFFNKTIASNFQKIHPTGTSFKFINPLIGFEVSVRSDAFPELYFLKTKIENYISKNTSADYKISMYYRNMEKGSWFGINDAEEYDPASLYKVPFMIAYLKAAEDNPSLLIKEITFTAADAEREKSKTSTQVSDFKVGESYSALELLKKMVVESSNSAKSLLTKNTDLNYLRETFDELGVPFLSDEYYKISAQKYSLFFRVLYNSTFLNREMSEKALDFLSQAEFEYGLRGGLPSDVVIAHKFGDHAIYQGNQISSLELHDCGIVYVTPQPYFLCIMTSGPDLKKLTEIIQSISKIVYEDTGKF